MRDSSLDEFFGGDGGDADDEPGDGPPAGDEPDVESDDDEPGDGPPADDEPDVESDDDEPGDAEGVPISVASVDPAVATSRWDESGTTCRACGASVTRRWHAPEADAYVCRDCKDW